MTLDVCTGPFADDLDAVAQRLDEAAARGTSADADFCGQWRPVDTGAAKNHETGKGAVTWADKTRAAYSESNR